MRGYVVLRDTPYMAKSDQDGWLTIRNLPIGKHKVRFWHERIGWFRGVEYAGGEFDRRGCLEVVIEPGLNEKPSLTVRAENVRPPAK